MGNEAVTRVTYDGRTAEGKALLETTELIFRSTDLRLKIPFRDIDQLDDADGELRVSWADSTAVFELGANASKWATKIRNPRGLLEKLGVKPDMRIAVAGVVDEEFLEQLHERVVGVSETSLPPEADIVFYEADRPEDLSRLSELRKVITRKGAVWVVSPKGKGAQIKDTDVMAAAKAAGLVDTKVVSFSDTHTALKLVIPVSRR